MLSKKAAVSTLFRMGIFGAAHGWRGKTHLPKICQVYPTIMKLGTLIIYRTNFYLRSQKCINFMTYPLSSADISTFLPEIYNFCYKSLLTWFGSLKVVLTKMVEILMMSPELDTLGLFKLKVT